MSQIGVLKRFRGPNKKHKHLGTDMQIRVIYGTNIEKPLCYMKSILLFGAMHDLVTVDNLI